MTMIEILPLLVFTTCGGIAAGAYVVAAFAQACAPGSRIDTARSWLFPLVCIVLLGVGLLGTLAHLGQPLRFMNGMANATSMISQESYWAIAFGVLMVIDLVIVKVKGAALLPVRWLAAVAGAGLMVVTGLAYYSCLFVAPWCDAVTIPLFIVGDLAMGAGLSLVMLRVGEVHRELHAMNVALSLAWLAVVVSYGAVALGLGIDLALIAAGALVGPVVSAAVSLAALNGKLPENTASVVVLVSAALGVLLVRGLFFAAGIL